MEVLQADSIKQFLDKHSIDIDQYNEKHLQYRYVRLRPYYFNMDRIEKSQFEVLSLKELEKDLQTTKISKISNSYGFIRIPIETKLSTSTLHKSAKIMGMDVSSGIAVLALQIEAHHHVLELCCAPGAKLCMIADQLINGNVTGVDISQQRLSTTRSLVGKLGIKSKVRLFCMDATKFDIKPVVDMRFKKELSINNDAKQGSNEIKPFYAPKHLRHPISLNQLYDRVLVDAECTHDGSIAHIKKYMNNSNQTFNSDNLKQYLCVEKSNNKMQLQIQLLLNGYNMLKSGGRIVYSTCSFTLEQNELVIVKFLDTFFNTGLFPIVNDISKLIPQQIPYLNGRTINEQIIKDMKIKMELKQINKILKHAIIYTPMISNTSTLFIISFTKP